MGFRDAQRWEEGEAYKGGVIGRFFKGISNATFSFINYPVLGNIPYRLNSWLIPQEEKINEPGIKNKLVGLRAKSIRFLLKPVKIAGIILSGASLAALTGGLGLLTFKFSTDLAIGFFGATAVAGVTTALGVIGLPILEFNRWRKDIREKNDRLARKALREEGEPDIYYSDTEGVIFNGQENSLRREGSVRQSERPQSSPKINFSEMAKPINLVPEQNDKDYLAEMDSLTQTRRLLERASNMWGARVAYKNRNIN